MFVFLMGFIYRLIASKFNLVLSKTSCDVHEYIPLWVVCDGKDAQVIILKFGVTLSIVDDIQTS